MDALKFLKEERRICAKNNCSYCPVSSNKNGIGESCVNLKQNYTEKYVEIIEKWSAEHPVKIRQSEFLELHPNADIREGILNLCPRRIDLDSVTEDECVDLLCSKCKEQYWLAEVK